MLKKRKKTSWINCLFQKESVKELKNNKFMCKKTDTKCPRYIQENQSREEHLMRIWNLFFHNFDRLWRLNFFKYFVSLGKELLRKLKHNLNLNVGSNGVGNNWD